MQHILFLSYDGLTDPLGQSQILPYLQGLTKFQFRFTIISCEKPANYKLYRDEIQSLIKNDAIRWLPLKYHKKPPVFSALYDLIAMRRLAVKVYRKDPYVMVHTRCGTPAMVGNYLKNKLGVKFLNDLRDFFAQSKVDSGQWPQRNPLFKLIFRYFQRQEGLQLQNSDGVVCLTHKAKSIILESIHHSKRTPLTVIPCSVDLALFDPQKVTSYDQQKCRQKLGLQPQDVVFSYLGSIGTWYLTHEMFELFKVIKTKIKNAKFLVISPDDSRKIIEICNRMGLSADDVIIRRINRAQVPLYLSLSFFSVFFIKPCFSKQASSPTKLGEIMSLGIPVITNRGVGDVAEIIDKFHTGFLTEQFNKSSYEKLVDKIMSETLDRRQIREAAGDIFDLEKAVAAYCSVYRKIISADKMVEKQRCTSLMAHHA